MPNIGGSFKALAFALSLGVAACGGGTTDTSESLRRGISANPDSVDPHKVSSQWENIVIGDMFTGLFTDGADATPVLGMAKSYEISDDALTWTFKLKDAKWSDGVPVTAQDFEFAFRRILTPETASQYASMLFLIKNSQEFYEGEVGADELGVKAIDDKTFEIQLNYPAPYLPGILKHYTSFPVPKHAIEEFGDDWTDPENIVVNGPYKLVQFRTGDFLRSVANPEFAGAEDLCFKEVIYYPYDDLDAIERYIQTGRLDINNAFDGQKTEELKEKFPGWVRTAPTLQLTYYSFNTDLEMFQDLRVRNALAMALDRDFMVNEVLTAGYQPAYSFVPPGTANYNGGAQVYWADWSLERRQEEARTLLKEAGYGPDNPLEFEYSYRSTDDNPRVAPAVQSSWMEIADWVKPEILQKETQVQYALLRQGDFQIGDGAWVADFNDPKNFLYLLESATGVMNYGNYNSPEYDALMAQSDRERDLDARAELLRQAEQTMLDDMAVIPMWFAVSKNLVDPSLTGFIDNADDVHRSRYICRDE
ncbi:MAG: peptide ABC transporter substrate-binding protein [Ponticaulis sp.]|nr:peptide ABC transporter substrate-binding protein [Ponticaulis sp.]|tara:strand:- start:56735 stop:58336 length:1602 start_codon:yes stop_codon:yes gene_type:complete